jgi:fibronectin-binding autotransporter adhesin
MIRAVSALTPFRASRCFAFARRVLACVCVIAVAVSAASAFGQTITWSGTTSNAWATSTNWNGGIAPGATTGTTNTDIALFNTNPTNKAPTWSTYLNLAGFTFDTGAGAYTIGTTSGSAAFLTSGGTTSIRTGVTAAQVINAPLVILNASGSNAGSYTFLNSSTASAATLTLGGAISGQATASNTTAITFNSNQAGTISGVISDGTAGGAVSLAKFGSGTLTLSGNNTYSGATTVNGAYAVWGDPNGSGVVTNFAWGNFGTVQVSGSLSSTSGISISGGGTFIDGNSTAASNNGITNRINSAATLMMGGTAGGGTFTMAVPAASNTHSQSLASLAIGPGYNLINANAATGTTNLTFTGPAGSVYTRSTGGMVNFVPGTGVFNIGFTNTPSINMSGTGSNAILVGAFLSGTNFVGLNSGKLTAATYTANGASSLTAGANIDMGSSTSGLTGVNSINSLRFNSGDTARQTVTLTSGTLVIASGGIITGTGAPRNVATAISGISGGALTSGTNELFFSTQNSADIRTSFGINIASQIVDNAAGAVGLNISGNSSVLLSNTNNSFTGNIYMNTGVLALSGNTGGRSAVTDGVLGGTNTIYATNGLNRILADLGSNPWTDKHSISIAPGAMLDISTQSGPVTINASVTGSGALGIGQSTYNQGTGIIIPVDQSGFTGTYAIGTFLRANEGVGLSSNANLLLAQMSVGGNGVLETSANMTRTLGSGPGQVRFGLAQSNSFGGGFSAVGTAGANPVTVSLGGIGTPQTLTWGAGFFMPANNGGNNGSGLVLQDGNANNTLTWANPISNNGYLVFVLANAPNSGTATAATMTGVISGAGGFGKTGAGLLVLTGPNTYTGKTSISNGSLSVSSLNSVTGGNASSNLGAPATSANGTIDIALGTLLYTGTGETTDRVVNLAGTTGGVTLDQSGGGLLKFSSALTATGSGAKTLTLQGSTAGTGEIAGAIVNYTGAGGPLATGVTKAGTGTWTLSGTSSYTGVTTISGGGILSVSNLANGGVTSAIGAATNVAANLVFSGTSTLQYTGPTATTDRSFTVGTNNTAVFDVASAATTLTLTGTTTVASGALTKAGAGTLTIAGALGNTGATTVNAGTLQIGNGSTTGNLGSTSSAIAVASGATLAFNRSDNYGGNFANAISGSGGITLLSGSLTFSNAKTYTGPTTVSGGVLVGGVANAFGSSAPLAVSSGTVNLNGFGQIVGALSGSAGGVITTSAAAATTTLTTSFASDTATFAGSIGNNGSGLIAFTKAGAGTQILSGNNTYTGATTVSGGALQIGNGGTTGGLSSSSAVSVASGAALAFSRTDDYGGNFANTISGSGGVTLLSGSLTLSSANTYTGDTSINAGTLQIASSGRLGSAGTYSGALTNNGAFSYSGTNSQTLSGLISGSGAFTKSGSGTLTLSASNTFTGDTRIGAGTLAITNASGLQNSTVNLNALDSGTVSFSQNSTLGGLTGSRNLDMGGRTLSVGNNNASTTFSGIMSNGALTKIGTGALTLTGSNTFAGPATISGGTLAVNGSLASGVAIDGGAFLGGSGSISGVLSGAGVVSPGNSPGILTAGQFDPTGGLGAAFEFTGFAPTYNAPTASVNDVLRLTDSTPFTSSLTSGNTIDVYFNVDSIASGDIFEGGFFAGLSAGDLLTNVQNAQFNFWIKASGGTTVFGGVNYASLTSLPGITGVTVNAIGRNADFGSGDVTGSVTQFVIVPEPGAIALAGVGIGLAGWIARRRK